MKLNQREEITSKYPYPIAKAYLRLGQSGSCRDDFDHLILLFEVVVKYLCILGLARYLKHRDAAGDEGVAPLDLTGMRAPSLGHWVGWLRKCFQFLSRSDPGWEPLNELTSLHLTADAVNTQMGEAYGAVKSFYEDREVRARKVSFSHFCDVVVFLRNKVMKERHVPVPERRWQEINEALLRGLEESLLRMSALREYPLVYIESVTRISSHEFVHSVQTWMGLEPYAAEDFVSESDETARDAFRVYLRSPDGEPSLSLFPFVIREGCKTHPGQQEIFIIDKVAKTPHYTSYQCGGEPESNVLEATEAFRLLVNGSISAQSVETDGGEAAVVDVPEEEPVGPVPARREPPTETLAAESDDQPPPKPTSGSRIRTGCLAGVVLVALLVAGISMAIRRAGRRSDSPPVSLEGKGPDRSLVAGQAEVLFVGFRGSSQELLTVAADGEIRLLNLSTSEVRLISGRPKSFLAAGADASGQAVLTVTDERTLTFWDLREGTNQSFQPSASTLTCAALSADAKVASAGCKDGTVVVRDLESDTTRTLKMKQGTAQCVAFNGDGSALAAGTDKEVVQLWPGLKEGTYQVLQEAGSTVLDMAFSPDGETLVTGSADGSLRMWRLGEDRVRTLEAWEGKVSAVAFDPQGKRVAAGGEGRRILLLGTAETSTPVSLRTRAGAVSDLAFSPDGRWLVVAAQPENEDGKTPLKASLDIFDLGEK